MILDLIGHIIVILLGWRFFFILFILDNNIKNTFAKYVKFCLCHILDISAVKNRLRAIIEIASTTRTPLAILITHCTSDKSKSAKIAKEVIAGFFGDMGVKNPPNIYFTDGLVFDTCFDSTNPASALLDVIAQVLRKSSPCYKGAVYQTVFGSDISVATDVTSKIENYLEKNSR